MGDTSIQPVDFEFAPLRVAHNYRAALVHTFSPYLRGRVVEVGAGIGQFTALLKQVPAITDLLAVEPEARFCDLLRELLPATAVRHGTAAQLDEPMDAIVSINVLEHIAEDATELSVYYRLLRERCGYVCLFTPARQEIYAPIDRVFGHYRRYHRRDLAQKLGQAGFALEKIYYFNALGYVAWWLTHCVLKKQRFNEPAVAFYDRFLFPLIFWLETTISHPPLGQSLVAIGRAG